MLTFAAICLGVAIVALAIAATVVLLVYSNAAGFYGSAARFADAIENRAARMRGVPQVPEQPIPQTGPLFAGMPEMPDILKKEWKARTEGSNIPDSWEMPEEV